MNTECCVTSINISYRKSFDSLVMDTFYNIHVSKIKYCLKSKSRRYMHINICHFSDNVKFIQCISLSMQYKPTLEIRFSSYFIFSKDFFKIISFFGWFISGLHLTTVIISPHYTYMNWCLNISRLIILSRNHMISSNVYIITIPYSSVVNGNMVDKISDSLICG